MVGLFLIHCAFVFLNSPPFILSLRSTYLRTATSGDLPKYSVSLACSTANWNSGKYHANLVASQFPVLLPEFSATVTAKS